MPDCPNGHEVAEGQSFCGQCGERVAAECPNGHPVEPGARFCTECGAAMGAEDDAETQGGRVPRWAMITAAGVAALVIIAIVAVLLLDDDDSADQSASTTSIVTTTTESTTTTQTTTTTVPLAAEGEFALNADGVGVATFGEDGDTVVQQLVEILGPPDGERTEQCSAASASSITAGSSPTSRVPSR